MRSMFVVAALVLASCASAPPPPLASDAEIEAAQNAPLNEYTINGRWNEPYEPFTVIGNIHYFGTAGVSAFLITTPDGHFLLDGIVPQSVPQIAANIRALGYDVRDVKYLLNSHAHFDHAGGLAGLQRLSGATMVASAADKPVLEAGDISYGPSSGMAFPPVRVDRVIGDNESLSLGGVTLTAHMTPGHTEGCTSWSMGVAGADGAQHRAFFHCSATVAGQSLLPEAYQGMVAAFRSTFARVRGMRADVFLANHENFFDLDARRARLRAGDANAFVDAGALSAFNTALEAAFEAELARQQGARAE
jgi:metallo-beta-lactamase class B